MKHDFTFLTKKQVFGINKLDIIKKYGTKCAITDFAILLGGSVSSICYTSKGNSRADRTGWWWTKTPYGNDAHVVDNYGYRSWDDVYKRYVGARPALSYSSISPISSNKVRDRKRILEVEYGEYPQTVVSEDFSRILEKAFANMSYSNNEMKTTGKSYTTDSVRVKIPHTSFQARTHTEYEYNGRKYIRFVGESNGRGEVLSDGRKIQDGSPYWVKVEPIKWLVDEKTNIALSKKLIFSGVQFKRENDYDGDFEKTDIKLFMDNHFSKDIIDERCKFINNKLEEIEDNFNIREDLESFIYVNDVYSFFDELNETNRDDDIDSFISCMNIVFDSDSYYELNSKLNLLKKACLNYSMGEKKKAFELIKGIDSDIHKERIDGKIVTYPTGCINFIEKPKRIIDRMKYLYSRIDDSFDIEYIDSIHENASSLKDLCNKINYYKLSKNVKRKVKSLFVK